MASPLSVFRKYQGPMLVVLGVILMISFLIVPLVLDYQESISRTGGVNRSEVVVRWDGGKLRESELLNLLDLHRRTIGFLDAVQTEARKQGGQPKIQPPPLRTNDRELVIMLLLAEKARQLGVVFSDDALREYLDQLADEALSHEDFDRVLRESTQGAPLYVSELYNQLRVELLAAYMDQLTDGAVQASIAQTLTSTPAQNWNRYLQLQRKVVLEMFPITVDDLINEVEDDPSEQEVKELYEKYKERFPNPNSPEPGFARLPEADFAYVKLDFNKFLEEEKQRISEEDVKAEYEKGLTRGDYRIPELPESPAAINPPTDDETGTPTETPAEGSPENPPTDESETPPADDSETTDGTTTEPTDTQSEPSGDPPTDENTSPADEPNPDDVPREAPNTEGASDPSGCGPLVQAEDEEVEEEETAGDEPPAPDAGPEETADEAADPPDTARPDAEPPQTEEPETDSAESQEAPPTEGTSDEQATDQVPAEQNATGSEPPKKHKTLEEVRDDILLKLASPRAQERQRKAEQDVIKELSSYSRKFRLWEQLAIEDPTRPKPEAPSYETLGERFGLDSGHTGTVDFYEAEKTELGNTSMPSSSPFAPARQFREIAFDLPLYEPLKVTENNDFDISYISWKLVEIPQKVPELSEVRSEVVTAWKRLQARKLAYRRASDLMKSASGDSGTLHERLPDHAEKIFQTNEFSYLRVTNEFLPGFGQLELSSVENVDAVDEDFMKAVFDKEADEIGVTKNAGESTYYVFRVARVSPSEDRLREMFLQEMSSAGFRRSNLDQLAQADAIEFKRNIYEDLEKEFDVEWIVPPLQRFQRQ